MNIKKLTWPSCLHPRLILITYSRNLCKYTYFMVHPFLFTFLRPLGIPTPFHFFCWTAHLSFTSSNRLVYFLSSMQCIFLLVRIDGYLIDGYLNGIVYGRSSVFRKVVKSVTEGWLEIDKHYSLELCFSIEKQPETVLGTGTLAGTHVHYRCMVMYRCYKCVQM